MDQNDRNNRADCISQSEYFKFKKQKNITTYFAYFIVAMLFLTVLFGMILDEIITGNVFPIMQEDKMSFLIPMAVFTIILIGHFSGKNIMANSARMFTDFVATCPHCKNEFDLGEPWKCENCSVRNANTTAVAGCASCDEPDQSALQCPHCLTAVVIHPELFDNRKRKIMATFVNYPVAWPEVKATRPPVKNDNDNQSNIYDDI